MSISNLILSTPTFSSQPSDTSDVIENTHCVYWNKNERGEGHWSEDGCSKRPNEADLTVCHCERKRQLSSFAVLIVRFI